MRLALKALIFRRRGTVLKVSYPLTAHDRVRPYLHLDRRFRLPFAGGAEGDFMNKIVAAILQDFSKSNGIEALEESSRFENLIAYLTIRRHFSRALDLKDVVVGKGATPAWMQSPLL
jgi:hypothetical protein